MVDAQDLPYTRSDIVRTVYGTTYRTYVLVRGKIVNMYYVYILKGEKHLYVGQTSDLERRIKVHSSGKVWTTKRMGAIELVYYEAFKAKKDAMRRERYFKSTKGKRVLKLMLIESLK